jgi:ABC-2 type transport system permease protein
MSGKNGLLQDTLTLYKREMAIFKSNLRVNIMRSIIFPFVIILFFGNIGSSLSHIDVAVVNYANNLQSTQFINTMQASQVVSVVASTTQDEALAMLSAGQVAFVVAIAPGFPSGPGPSVQVYYSNTDLQITGTVMPIIEQAAAQFGAASYQGAAPSASHPQPIVTSTPVNGATANYRDFLYGSILAMVVMFGAMFGGGISMITDRQFGNIKSFLITPINKNAIILSRLLSSATQTIVYVAAALGVGVIFSISIAMWLPLALLWIVVVSVIMAIGFTAVALMLSIKIKRVEIYAIMSQVITLPAWFLSGAFFPTSSLPSWLYPLSVINPATYAVEAYRSVILTGYFPLSSALTSVGVLIIFAIAATLLCLKLFTGKIE